MDWQSIACEKRASLLASIPARWRLKASDIPSPRSLRCIDEFVTQRLDAKELEITNSSSTEILAKASAGIWSAVDITRAFCHRAAVVHQLTNCLSEICFFAAERRAEELDEYLLETGRTVGPLHGLPVSLKDRYNLEGLDSASGYISWLGKPKDSASEGCLVKGLRRCGAIFFVKTNVPMSMLMGETCNNIFGSTANPFNRLLNAGGASGGEGALLAMRGSPLGWGSDTAGSIRIPCSYNHIYGLRVSYGRLPISGMTTSLPGLPTAVSVSGPMSADLSTIELGIRSVLETEPWNDDSDVIELPWRENKRQKIRDRVQDRNGRLVFGIMYNDGTVQPHPPVQRAIKIVTMALIAQGHEVIAWDPPRHSPEVETLFQIFGATAGIAVRKAIDESGEPPMPQLRSWYECETNPMPSSELWDLCDRRDHYRAKYLEYWNSSHERTKSNRNVDGVILPVSPSAAVQENQFPYYGYSAIVNVLDYTSGSFPVTFADHSLDLEQPDYEPMNPTDRAVWQAYNKELFHGAPVGVQIMGRRLQEEKVIGLLEAITTALSSHPESSSL